MTLKAIITVAYSDISDTGESFCPEDNYLSITPLHANLHQSDCCFQDCSDLLPTMIENLVDENKLEIEPYTLYHSIFKASLIYSSDYYGEVDVDHELELIDHAKIGTFDENNNLTYCDERVQSSFEMIELG